MDKPVEVKKLSDAELGKKLREGREKAQKSKRLSTEEREVKLEEKYKNMKANQTLRKIRDTLKGDNSSSEKLGLVINILEKQGLITFDNIEKEE